MPTTFPHTTFAAWLQGTGVSSVGIILDTSGSVPQSELHQVMVATADLPTSAISGIALTDTQVQKSGSRDEILYSILSSRNYGGGTDFSRIAEDAWKRTGCPPHLALISDGESARWPARFPVPTTIFLIDRHGPTIAKMGPNHVYKLPPCTASTNVQDILVLDLPALQDLSRGLD